MELLHTDIDTADFMLPNGAFNGKRFELLSYNTDTREEGDATPYLAPATALPPSETRGLGELDPQGKVLGNLPPINPSYIRRRELEDELFDTIMKSGRHPVITVSGRGGIGKTWLTLCVLRNVVECEDYLPILEAVARRHVPARLMLAQLHEESETPEGLSRAKAAVRSFLEAGRTEADKLRGWQALADICRRTSDAAGEIQAKVEMSRLAATPFWDVSRAAWLLNKLLREKKLSLERYEKNAIVLSPAKAMETRLAETSAVDCSRLAWLYLNAGDEKNASRILS